MEDKNKNKSKAIIILDSGDIIFPLNSSSFSDSSSSNESYKGFALFKSLTLLIFLIELNFLSL